MFVSKNNFYISPEDYLEGERVSPIKHEYRRGHVYAMTGAKKPHIIITSNLVRRWEIILMTPTAYSFVRYKSATGRG